MPSQCCKTSRTCPTCTTVISVQAVEYPAAEGGFNLLGNGVCSTTAGDSTAAKQVYPILESQARIDWLLGAALG